MVLVLSVSSRFVDMSLRIEAEFFSYRCPLFVSPAGADTFLVLTRFPVFVRYFFPLLVMVIFDVILFHHAGDIASPRFCRYSDVWTGA